MSALKILKKDIPEIRFGSCVEDPSISENHAKVMSHLCAQMELMVDGINNHNERIDEKMERLTNGVSSLREDVARWHEEFALTTKDVSHLSQDVDRMGNKVRTMDDRRWEEHTSEDKDNKASEREKEQIVHADRRALLSPVVTWIIAGVVALTVLGFGSYVKETARIENQAIIKQIIIEELKSAVP